MTAIKKYDYVIELSGDTWTAKITRKVSSQKRVTTKEKTGFGDETLAKEWAQVNLLELTEKLKLSNTAQQRKRKESKQARSERSARKAKKTEKAKQEVVATETHEVDEA